MRFVALSLLCAVTLYGQGSQTPIYNGLLQSDLNAAGFKINGANLVDYAGTNVSWNVATNKFDVTGGVGTVTSITATAPVVVTPSPLISTGVISITPGTFEVPLTFSQSLARAVNTVTLSGDSATPGNSQYYGTNSGGTKGWYALPAAGVSSFSSGDLSPLFTTTEPNTAGAVAQTFTLSTAAANSWFGNATGSTATPAFNTSVFPAALMPALLGDVTNTAGSLTTAIGSGKVTYAKMQNVSANNRLLGAGSAGTGLPPAEITVGSGLTMTGTTLTAAAGGGTVTSITATSPIVVAPTPLTATGVVSLDKTVDLAMTAVQSVVVSNVQTNAVTDILTLGHNSSSSVVANFGTGLLFNAEDSTTDNTNIGEIQTVWTTATHLSNVSKFIFRLTNGGLSLASAATLNGTGILDVGSGFQISSTAPSGRILIGDGTKYVQSTPTWPNAASTANKVVKSDGSNLVMSTETWAVPGAATNFLKSDGTNWTAAQPAFSSLTGSATAAQMPAFTGDVTSPAGSTVNTLVNIPLTTTIAGAAGARGDVLYYGASGWAKLGAGTNGNQLTTHSTGADPTWDAPGAGGSGTPGGGFTTVQFNDSGAFGGDGNLLWDKTNKILSVVGFLTNDSKLRVGSLEFQPYTVNNAWIGENMYLNGASWIARYTGYGGQFYFLGNEGQFKFAPSVAAGGTFSPVAVAKFNLDGTFGVGSSINITAGNFTNTTFLVKGATAQIGIASNYTMGWSGTSGDASATIDTAFARNTGGVVEVNNGTVGTYRDIIARTHNATSGYQINGTATAADYLNSSVSSQSPSTADVYLTGSNVVVPAGAFAVKGQYRCLFDVTKSAGTGGIVISVRTGTLGTTGDTAQLTFTFPAGTSVADVGTFEVFVNWRTVGSGTSAVIEGVCRAQKNTVTAAGLWSDTSAAKTIVATVSSGFASNTFTNMGVSFNGGTAFAGTVTTVQASLVQ